MKFQKKDLKGLAKLINGEVLGDENQVVDSICGLEEAQTGDLSFILDERAGKFLAKTNASCVIVGNDLPDSRVRELIARGISFIKVSDPLAAFSTLIEQLFPELDAHPSGINEKALVSSDAVLGKDVAIGPYCVISRGAQIGDNTVIYPFCFIGEQAKIGADCIIYPNVSMRERTVIGDRVIIHSGAVLGSDGFGFVPGKDGIYRKIPHIGGVIVEEDVEIGANVCIDRGKFSDTVIKKGTKLDNLIQVAHNVKIGPHAVIAAQSGIAGSSKVGAHVLLGGQVGISDHISVGDRTMIGAKSGLAKSCPPGSVLLGNFTTNEYYKQKRIVAAVKKLPDLMKRLSKIFSEKKEE